VTLIHLLVTNHYCCRNSDNSIRTLLLLNLLSGESKPALQKVIKNAKLEASVKRPSGLK